MTKLHGADRAHPPQPAPAPASSTRARVSDSGPVRRESGPVPRDTVPSPPPPEAIEAKRVLVVDDEPLLARAIQRFLRHHDVVVCTNGRQALAHILAGERFDAILSDVAMPGMSGCELYEEVRRRVPEQAARFVFLTGDSHESRTKGFLASYGRPILDKPFDPRALRAFVEKLVG